MSILIQTTLALTVLCSALLGLIVFKKRRLTLQHFFLIVHFISITAWAYSTLVVLQQGSMWAVKAAFASAVVLVISKYYFIITFPEGKIVSKPLTYLPLALAGIVFVLSLLDNTLFTGYSVEAASYVLIEHGPYANIYMLVISVLLIYPIINLYRKMRSKVYEHPFADQIKFLFIGVTFFFVLGLTSNSVLPVLFDIHYFNGIGPSLSLVLAGFILYIIGKYNFLGLSLFIQRGFIYTTLITAIVALYLGLLYLLENVFQQPTNVSPVLSSLITAIIGIFSVPRLDSYLRAKTDKWFFRGGYNYSDSLQHFCEVLNPSVEIDDIKNKTAELLRSTLKTRDVIFDIKSTETNGSTSSFLPISNEPDSVIVPLVSNNKLIGNLILKEKLSGDPYTTSDLQLLKTLSYNLAMAFERALLYKKLRDYSKGLEEEVAERTIRLKNAYTDQRTMISNIAHGLQTPLTIIEGEMENLRIKETSASHLVPLRRSLESISSFINSLLRLARLESEIENIEMEKCNLGSLVQEIVSYVAILADDKGVSLKFNSVKDVYVYCNPKKIEEGLLAILSNALKYKKPDKRSEVKISINRNSHYANVIISDTGIGIPHESLPNIFNRFYRSRNNEEENIQGSGLGLSIAKAIVNMHNGSIYVESEEGAGTTFKVTLPLYDESKYERKIISSLFT